MKNKFLYILTFLILLLINVNPLNAAESPKFTCEYDWRIGLPKRMNNGEYASDENNMEVLDLKVVGYNDGSVKFLVGNTELTPRELLSVSNKFFDSTISFDTNAFYEEITKNDCPATIVTKSGILPNSRSFTLLFGDTEEIGLVKDAQGNARWTIVSSLKNNSESRKDSTCSFSLIYGNDGNFVYGLNIDLEIKLAIDNKGNKKIGIGQRGSSPTLKIYDNSPSAQNVFYVNNYVVSFLGGSSDNLFIQSSTQKENNTFTCPSGNSLYVVRTLENINGEDCSYNSVKTCFVVTADKSLADQWGVGDEPASPEEGDLDSYYENVDVNFGAISSKTGTCVDYLGSASDEKYDVADLLDDVYDVIKIGSVILVIVLSMLEFSGVITKSKDELMAAVKKLATRLIILAIILLLPTFIDILGNLFGIEDILCGIK